MLIAIENLLSKSEVAAVRERLDTAAWQDGAATAGGIARRQKHNLQLDDAAEPALSLSQEVLRRVRAHPTFISAALPRKIYPPKFNRYEDGGEYGAHVDSAILQTLAGETLRSDLSATLFLAEPDTYEGGELQIEGPFGVQEVKLEAGSMVLYPSSSLHRVTPVTRGARVAAFFWIESLVRDDTDRTLMFDLDRAIQGLTATAGPDNAELVRLTHVYHNLLRRWAAT